MKTVSILFLAILSFSNHSWGRDYDAIEKLAKYLSANPRESELKDLIPKNTKILGFNQVTKTLILQEISEPSACYILFESKIAHTNHRFGTIVMSDSYSLPTTDGEWQIWESAKIVKISDERIEISLHRLDQKNVDTAIVVRSDPKLNSIWKFEPIGPARSN